VGETYCNCPADCAEACGDGCCSVSEDFCTCATDCADVCGDGCCSASETYCNCAADCAIACGDGCCSTGENSSNCPADCGVICDLSVSELFTSSTLPSGWTIDNYDGEAYTWVWSNSNNTTGGAGGYYWVDGDNYFNHDDRLITTNYDLGGCSSADLEFYHDYNDYDVDDYGYLQISVDGGPWQNVQIYSADSIGLQTFDLTSFVSGAIQFQIRYRYVGYWDWWWKVDNFQVTGTP
jgi:hypothetical protein